MNSQGSTNPASNKLSNEVYQKKKKKLSNEDKYCVFRCKRIKRSFLTRTVQKRPKV